MSFVFPQETAEILSKVITHDLLENLRSTSIGMNELTQIMRVLRKIRFLTQSGDWKESRSHLLSGVKGEGINDDEPLRATFAPAGIVLASSYRDAGLSFFALCREKLDAPVDLMLDWILQAEDIKTRQAALKYLISGELGDRLAAQIRNRGINGTYLASLNHDDPVFEGWSIDEIDEVLIRRLFAIDILRNVLKRNGDIYEIPIDVNKTLNNIWDWWRKNSLEIINKYNMETYPDGQFPDVRSDDSGGINRNNWLTIFVLGACHTFGKTRRQQHRGFIQLCREKGWWNIFAGEFPEKRADEWMRVLDNYVDEQVDSSEYEMWMNRFPAIYRIARYLNDYVDIFLDIDRNNNIFNSRQSYNYKV